MLANVLKDHEKLFDHRIACEVTASGIMLPGGQWPGLQALQCRLLHARCCPRSCAIAYQALTCTWRVLPVCGNSAASGVSWAVELGPCEHTVELHTIAGEAAMFVGVLQTCAERWELLYIVECAGREGEPPTGFWEKGDEQ